VLCAGTVLQIAAILFLNPGKIAPAPSTKRKNTISKRKRKKMWKNKKRKFKEKK
jgi:hypothetical protein